MSGTISNTPNRHGHPGQGPGAAYFDAHPARELTPEDIAEAERRRHPSGIYEFGMGTAVGAARLSQACADTEDALAQNLPRRVAMMVLIGHLALLEADGHCEWSDTVVRESIRHRLEMPFLHAGMLPPSDDEIVAVSMWAAQGRIDTERAAVLRAMQENQPD